MFTHPAHTLLAFIWKIASGHHNTKTNIQSKCDLVSNQLRKCLTFLGHITLAAIRYRAGIQQSCEAWKR